MNKKPKLAQVADRKARPPVRVKLERKNCYVARAHPPDGEKGVWWERLKDALGTASSAFVEASSFQLIAAARLPGGGISEIAVNAALAFIEGAKPRDEVESALVIQIACTHTATMAVREAWRSTWPGPKPPYPAWREPIRYKSRPSAGCETAGRSSFELSTSMCMPAGRRWSA
jgi:hypothetical protein